MNERTRKTEVIFTGRLLRLERLKVELDDGRPAVREIVRHPGAVGVLPRLPDGRFVLVRQYRKAVEAAAVEVCAGLLDPGETPENAARRELLEETGRRARRWVYLGRVWSSPGYTDEAVDVFFAECEKESQAAALDEEERVEPLVVRADEIEAMILRNDIRDAKTIAVWQLYRLKVRD